LGGEALFGGKAIARRQAVAERRDGDGCQRGHRGERQQ
jgi:hypothetical protein